MGTIIVSLCPRSAFQSGIRVVTYRSMKWPSKVLTTHPMEEAEALCDRIAIQAARGGRLGEPEGRSGAGLGCFYVEECHPDMKKGYLDKDGSAVCWRGFHRCFWDHHP